MNKFQPYPYQEEARDLAIHELFVEGKRSTLIVMPTGTGKTAVAAMCAQELRLAFDKPILFIAQRKNLVRQAFRAFTNMGLDSAIEMADEEASGPAGIYGEPATVIGSLQTLCREDRLKRWPKDTFNLVVIDECHHALSESYQTIINHFDSAKVLGITATPQRGDNRNLGALFESKCFQYGVAQAIREGYLVPLRHRVCPVSVDLSGLTKRANRDYLDSELALLIGPAIEGLARSFQKEVGDRPAVAFLPDTSSTQAFSDTLVRLGVKARYVVGSQSAASMSPTESAANLEDFNHQKFQVIVSCDMLFEGWDAPHCSAVGVIRPTNQWYRFCQMVGRGTRIHPQSGKTDCLIIDYDWKTRSDVKDLCTIIDIFDDGSLEPEVVATAKKIIKEKPQDTDAAEIIAEATEIVRTRRKCLVTLTGTELQYKAWEHDPISVSKTLDVKLNHRFDFDKTGDNPATDRQRNFLRALGVKDPEYLSKWGASKLISKLKERRELGLATPVQVNNLIKSGVNPETARSLKANEAKRIIQDMQNKGKTKWANTPSASGTTQPRSPTNLTTRPMSWPSYSRSAVNQPEDS